MKYSDTKREYTRKRSVEQHEQNMSLLDAMREDLAEADMELSSADNSGNEQSYTEHKGDYEYDEYTESSRPSRNRDDDRSQGGSTAKTKNSKSSTSTGRSSIRMSLTPRSMTPPLQRNAGPRKSVLKGGDYWKSQKDGGGSSSGGEGSTKSASSRLYVKSDEQLAREAIDINDFNDLKRQVANLTQERDILLKEKDTWLMRVKKDNVGLAAMLKHVKTLKGELVKAVDEVTTEKMALRSMKMDYLSVSLEEYLLGDDCAVSESRRKFFPPSKKDAAAAFCEQLMNLSAACRENQVKVGEYVKELVTEAEGAFVKGDQKTTDEKLDALKNVASAEPGNYLSAQAAAASITEAMVGAMQDRAAEVLAHRASHLSHIDSNGIDGRLGRKDEEIQALITQTENLKANVNQWRKKYQVLLEKATAKAAAGGGAPPGVGGANNNNNNNNNKSNHLFADENKQQRNARKSTGMGQVHGGYGETHSQSGRRSVTSAILMDMPKVEAEELKMTHKFDALPFEVRKQANDALTQYVTTVVNAHPLSVGMRPVVIKETINEVATQMHGILGLALGAYSEQGAIDYKTADRKATKEMLTKVIQLPSVQNEVCTYVHMLLTYLFARYSESSAVEASSKMVIKAGDDTNAAALAMSSGGTSNKGSSNQDYASAFAPAGMIGSMSQQQMHVAAGGGGNPFTGSTAASESVGAPVTMPGRGGAGAGAGGVPSRGGLASNMMAQKSAAGAATGTSRASSGMGGIKFNKASMPKDKPKPPPPAKAGDPRSNHGTGEYGNVFFAAGGDAPDVMSLLPSPKEKPKVDPKLPTFMQPVPKKKDRR